MTPEETVESIRLHENLLTTVNILIGEYKERLNANENELKELEARLDALKLPDVPS